MVRILRAPVLPLRLLLASALFSFLCLSSVCFATEWEQVDDSDGIVVSRKAMTDSPLMSFRGITVMNQSMGRVLRVIGDDNHRLNWIDRLKRSKILERKSFYDFMLYQEFGLPFPISNRDYVYHGVATRAANGTVTVHLTSVEHPKSPEVSGVRANLINSFYRLTPMGPDKTRVEVEIQTDPKGWLPSWMVNIIQKSWPLKTLVALRKETAKDWVTPVALPPVK